MRVRGFIGPAYTLKSVNADAQACINLYPEINEAGTAKDGEVSHLLSTPGLEKILNVGEGPIRGLFLADFLNEFNERVIVLLVVSKDELYSSFYDQITNTFDTPSFVLVDGGITTTSGPITFANFTDKSLIGIDYSLVFTDTVNAFRVQFSSGGSINAASYTYLAYDLDPKASHIAYIDGYLIYNELNSNQFYVSDVDSINIDPLSFASAEGNPDLIVALAARSRDLIIFNEKSTEVFINTGNADFPFERAGGGYIEKGCVAPYSPSVIDSIAFWLGRDETGQGIVFAMQGLTPQRVSTHAIEQQISTYANIKDAVGYTYQKDGHSFYVLNFAEATWVYDLTTRLWHQRASSASGPLLRHRANFCAFASVSNHHIVGDYANNKVYLMKDNYFLDDTDPITRVRSSPHLSNNLKRGFISSFQLDMEVGVGLDGSGQGSDPQVMLTYSKDGGHTYSSESWASAGKKVGGIGEYKKRVIWRRLGQTRDMIFKVKVTDPVKVVLLGAEIEFEGGTS
jgi:Phage stabilisation protein